MKINQNIKRLSQEHLETVLGCFARDLRAQMPDTEAGLLTMYEALSPVTITPAQMLKFEQYFHREVSGHKPEFDEVKIVPVIKSKAEFKRRLRENDRDPLTVVTLNGMLDGIKLSGGQVIRPVPIADKSHGSVIKFELDPSSDSIYIKADEVYAILEKNARIASH